MARSRQNLSWIRSSYSLHASVHLYSFPLEGDPSPAPSARFSDEVHVCTRRAMDVDIRGLSLPSASSTSGFSCGSDAGCCTSSWWSCPSACRSSLHSSATFDSTHAFGQIHFEEGGLHSVFGRKIHSQLHAFFDTLSANRLFPQDCPRFHRELPSDSQILIALFAVKSKICVLLTRSRFLASIVKNMSKLLRDLI
ncbi:uncharacterized protein [Triticum aestivum]|uniref:uncharacterized protein isoform X1 n=1 Tax=Triticum aestivum TaxID=4565 RepID=UPI00098B5D6F|nr:uncharacterized protein LOC109763875 [Aegilops tauschii subsp. strangulata]XP_044327619.1 uncharacterized protein LOC123048625 isoform X1 [Triticum aestivum]